MRDEWKNLNQFQVKLYKQLYKKSFLEFTKAFWECVDPQPLIMGSVIQIFCEIAQYMARPWIGYTPVEIDVPTANEDLNIIDIRNDKSNVCINVPPRHTKSKIFSVMFPVWSWLKYPTKSASISHTLGLALDFNKQRQKLINSEKFKFFFGNDIVVESNSAYKLRESRGGEMYSIPRESATGYGGDIFCLDDITNAAQARKDKTEMLNAWSFMTDTLPSRINNLSSYVIFNIQQRLAPNDITGRILNDAVLSEQYNFIVLPAIFEKDTIFVCPISGDLIKFKKGDYLWPERFGDYSALRAQVGETVFQTQYLQKPTATGDTVIKEHMIIEKGLNEVPSIDNADVIYASHDFPVKDKETSDYLGSILAYKVGANLYIHDCLEERLSFVASINYVRALEDKYYGIIQIIEDKANGSPILQQMSEVVSGLQPFQPGTASKVQRAESASYYMNNVIFIKNKFDKINNTWILSEKLKKLKDRLLAFPMVEHDDICDALFQLILFVYMDKRFSVYARSFNIKENTIRELPDLKYTNIFFNRDGDNWKVCEIGVKYGVESKLYVIKEKRFIASIDDAINIIKEFSNNKKLIIDCSTSSSLYNISGKDVTIIRYTPDDFDQSVAKLNLALSKRLVLLSDECKGIIGDIENFKYSKSDNINDVKYKTKKDGYVACLRTALNYYGGIV